MGAPIGNKYALGYGKPGMYKNADDMQKAIEEYFTWIEGEEVTKIGTATEKVLNEETNKHELVKKAYEYTEWVRHPERPTITGLALFLGFESKQSMYDYEKKESFAYPIKRARMMIEHAYEQNLHQDKPAGSIFALKNMGWVDKQEIDQTTRIIDLNDELDSQ